MKNTLKSKHIAGILPIAAAVLCSTTVLQAASTLTAGPSPTMLVDNDLAKPFGVSVYGDTLRYASLAGAVPTQVDVTASGSVEAYQFVGTSSGSITSALSGGGLITTTNTGTAAGRPHAAIWTTTNPAGAFTFGTAANYDGAGYDAGLYGARDFTTLTGTIDISALTAGTVYLFYGANNRTTAFNLTMTDLANTPGGDITLTSFGQITATGNDFYVASFDFTNDGAYDRITYAQTGTNLRYFGAVVVTPVPEPGTALLGGLGLLALLRRRRR